MKVTPEQSRRVQDICFDNGIEWQDTKKKLHQYEHIIIKKDCLVTCDSTKWFNEYYIEIQEIDADLFIRTNGSCGELSKDKMKEFEADNKLLQKLGYGTISLNCQCKPRKLDIERNNKAIEEFKEIKKNQEWQNEGEAGLYYENIQLKKKIENLHIALKKKDEKNKLQATEITLLLKQKEDLKEQLLNETIRADKTLILLKEKPLRVQFNMKEINEIKEHAERVIQECKETTDSKLLEKDTIIKYLEQKCKLN